MSQAFAYGFAVKCASLGLNQAQTESLFEKVAFGLEDISNYIKANPEQIAGGLGGAALGGLGGYGLGHAVKKDENSNAPVYGGLLGALAGGAGGAIGLPELLKHLTANAQGAGAVGGPSSSGVAEAPGTTGADLNIPQTPAASDPSTLNPGGVNLDSAAVHGGFGRPGMGLNKDQKSILAGVKATNKA